MYTMECLVEKVFKGENKVILTKKKITSKYVRKWVGAISYLRGAAHKFTSKKIFLSKLEIRRAERIHSNIIKNK